MNTPSWEQEFDEKFLGNEILDILKPTNAREIKSFIKEHFIPREKVREVIEVMLTFERKNPLREFKNGVVVDVPNYSKGYIDALTDVLTALLDEETRNDFSPDDRTVEDDFGSSWSVWCPECKTPSISVVRPGKVQCDNCE